MRLVSTVVGGREGSLVRPWSCPQISNITSCKCATNCLPWLLVTYCVSRWCRAWCACWCGPARGTAARPAGRPPPGPPAPSRGTPAPGCCSRPPSHRSPDSLPHSSIVLRTAAGIGKVLPLLFSTDFMQRCACAAGFVLQSTAF